MINIQRIWMMHEGGTKFYQAFKISLKSKNKTVIRDIRECTVIHYGPIKALKGEDKRPVNGGAVVVYSGGSKYGEKAAEKAKRGYHPRDATSDDYENNAAAVARLTHLFGASNRDHILIQMGLSTSFGQDDDEDDDSDPTPEPEDTSIDKFKDRPAAWGTW